MHLSDYFKGLRKRQQIDEMILETICSRMNPAPGFLGRAKWEYSAVVNWNYEFVYVPWKERGICYGSVDVPTHDLLSNQFSGCCMGSYTDRAGNRFGAHINVSGRNHPDDCRDSWNRYMISLQNPATYLFQPDVNLVMHLVRLYPAAVFDLWGIISNRTGECFSVVVKGNDYVLSNYDKRYCSPVYFECMVKERRLPTHLIL